jgi:hypothetical protein
LPLRNAETPTPTQFLDVADATSGVDPMNIQICTPPVTPVVVVATHEELVRSARDMWVVAVSLLTELTPAKFTLSPWAAARFTAELPFILAKLWHIQQALITSAHSYMQTETMLKTVLETIDVPKLLKEFSSWAVDLAPIINLPFGFSQHVPSVDIMPPTEVNIIKQRFDETTWSGQALIREETYKLADGTSSHWFYLPKGQDWAVISGQAPMTAADERLSDFIRERGGIADQVHYVAEIEGELVIPDALVMENHQSASGGRVQIFQMEDLENAKRLEQPATDE